MINFELFSFAVSYLNVCETIPASVTLVPFGTKFHSNDKYLPLKCEMLWLESSKKIPRK